MVSILSELVRLKRFLVIKDADVALEAPKTRDLLSRLAQFGVTEALVVVKDWDTNLYLAARNLSKVEICEIGKIDPVSLVKYKNVIMTEEAVRQIEEVLG
jgi:large subunit ribosomal protein L4